MGIERTNAQANNETVILIAQLLEFVDAGFP